MSPETPGEDRDVAQLSEDVAEFKEDLAAVRQRLDDLVAAGGSGSNEVRQLRSQLRVLSRKYGETRKELSDARRQGSSGQPGTECPADDRDAGDETDLGFCRV